MDRFVRQQHFPGLSVEKLIYYVGAYSAAEMQSVFSPVAAK